MAYRGPDFVSASDGSTAAGRDLHVHNYAAPDAPPTLWQLETPALLRRLNYHEARRRRLVRRFYFNAPVTGMAVSGLALTYLLLDNALSMITPGRAPIVWPFALFGLCFVGMTVWLIVLRAAIQQQARIHVAASDAITEVLNFRTD